MEHAGIPDTKRGEITTFHGLQSISRWKQMGKHFMKIFRNQKIAGGPASFGLFRHDMKRPRNVKVHSQLPADVNASMLRIKNGIVNDPGIHLSIKKFVFSLTPNVRQEIGKKSKGDRCLG
jgi:hypothetical protein